jgi:hypothetical protein
MISSPLVRINISVPCGARFLAHEAHKRTLLVGCANKTGGNLLAVSPVKRRRTSRYAVGAGSAVLGECGASAGATVSAAAFWRRESNRKGNENADIAAPIR